MGDAGSMFLGFSITWFFIDLSQGPARAMSPVTALWLLMIPLFDTVWLLFKRPLGGRWPTAASHDHVHHVLQMAGLGAAKTTLLLWAVAALGAVVGVAGTILAVSEALLFYGFLALFAFYVVVMSALSLYRKRSSRAPQDDAACAVIARRKSDHGLNAERRRQHDRREP